MTTPTPIPQAAMEAAKEIYALSDEWQDSPNPPQKDVAALAGKLHAYAHAHHHQQVREAMGRVKPKETRMSLLTSRDYASNTGFNSGVLALARELGVEG